MMKTRKVFSLVPLALICLLLPRLTVAADDGGKVFANACLTCHTAQKLPLDRTRLSKEEWSEALARMISYGAEIPKGKLPELLGYLVRTQGTANTTGEVKK